MATSHSRYSKQLLLTALSFAFLSVTPVLAVNYDALGCYSDGDEKTLGSRYQWQTSSYCSFNCTDYNYFYIRNTDCYCTNDKPSTEGTCNIPCPGFGTDTCGGASAFNYFENLLYIASTTTSSSSQASSSSFSSSSSSSSSSHSSTKASSTYTSSKISSSVSSSSPQSSGVTSLASSTSDSEDDQSTFSTVTKSNKETVYVTPSSSTMEESSAATSSASSEVEKSDGGISGGAIAGIVVGVLGGIAALIAILLLWRRRNSPDAYTASRSPNNFVDPFGARAEDKMAFGHTPPDAFMAIDQRLNPVMLGERRLSEGSIADERDYSRKILRVANPDD